MTATLVLTEQLAAQIEAATRYALETAGVLLVRSVTAPNGDMRFLGQKIFFVPDPSYLKRENDQLLIRSEGYLPALSEAETTQCTAFWFHTHPGRGGMPLPSERDKKVDQLLAEVFRIRTGSPYYGTLITSPSSKGFRFSGRVHSSDNSSYPLDKLWRVGSGFQLLSSVDSKLGPLPLIFDRNVRAFGSAIQQMLRQLTVGVVGVGGTGSSICEQLARLGVRKFLLADPDTLTGSNVTRVYGSSPEDVGRLKVDVLCGHIKRIAADSEIERVPSSINSEGVARKLMACDVVFGCTDDNAGRLVLSRLSTFMLTPVIDVGVLISSDEDDNLLSIDGRVTILTPGSACLVCRQRIDLPRAAAELQTSEEHKRLQAEGYAPALNSADPAVVAFTTSVASTAVAELLERFVGYGPTLRPSEILLRWHEREISTNICQPRPGHYCDPLAGKLGRGDTKPFLEQAWAK